MLIHSAQFVCSAVTPGQYPPPDLPEVAFAGRSNVGKSSLINKLLNRKKLVRTSKTPGRTQLINFFEVNGRWRFVDLPGYGFAKVPVEVKRRWWPMVETYLTSRPNLGGIVLLFDVRRTPSEEDLGFWHWLKSQGLVVIPVLTKVDKVKRTQGKKQVAKIATSLESLPGKLIQFSALSGQGREKLWTALQPLVEPEHLNI
jgi:GTP-binding protein